jgi:tetratricopeptide (TPR) repeat protein
MASKTQAGASPSAAATTLGQKAKEALVAGASGQKTWGEILGINAGQAYNMAQMGYRLLQQGQIDDARTMFQGLATLNPKDPYMHLALGSCYHRCDAIDAAIAEYSKAIELNPKLANAYANRGELHIQKKEPEKAFQDLKKAVDLDPKGQDPSTIRARAILATAAAKVQAKASTAKAPAAPKKK